MAKFFLNICFLVAILFSPSAIFAYDETNLDISSKIIPRFILMSSQKKSIKKEMNICILHTKLDEQYGSVLADKIKSNYPGGANSYPLVVNHTDYKNTNYCKSAQLVYLFNTDHQTLEKTLHMLNENKIISMSYDPSYLEDGVQVSVYLGRKVLPFVNIKSLKNNNIELNPVLLQISKIYQPGADQ